MDVDLQRLAVGHHRLPCTECERTKRRARDTALAVDVDARGGVYLCHRCGWRGGWRAGTAATAPQRAQASCSHLHLASEWRAFWRDLKPISGTAAEYLTARRCAIPPKDGDLRCAEALRHPSGYVGPGLVALVTDAITGEPMTLHRTWITATGMKANVDPPRLLLGKHRKQGGVIRLWPDDAVTTSLGVAEGIESALALATSYAPVWSCIDAGNLAALPVLDGVESLLIAADHDPAGLRAADECGRSWHRAGREVRIAKSPIPGEDMADLVARCSA